MPFEDELQQLQRRCGIMFELSVSLLRVVEIIAREVPQLILNEELNLTRLCELLVRVISRTTTGMLYVICYMLNVICYMLYAVHVLWYICVCDETLNIKNTHHYRHHQTGHNATIFESVISLGIMTMGRVALITRFTILGPIVGIMLNLDQRYRENGIVTSPPPKKKTNFKKWRVVALTLSLFFSQLLF